MITYDRSSLLHHDSETMESRSTQVPAQPAPNQPSAANPDLLQGPLALDGWLEFNRVKWGLEPQRFLRGSLEAEHAALNAVFYANKQGKLRHPRRNPYTPVTFRPTPTTQPSKLTRQWLDLATPLAEEMRHLGVINTITLPPEVTDVRPWIWSGFQVGVMYTYIVDFPFDDSLTSTNIRREIRKSRKAGFRVERTTDMKAVQACLASSESRQGYDLGLTARDLDVARDLLGDEHFHAYVAYAPNGDIAAVSPTLMTPGTNAICLSRGTHTEYLSSGVAKLLDAEMFEQLAGSGAIGYDYCGANMPSIANYKAAWGARLVPYYSIQSYSLRRLARWSLNWWQFRNRLSRGG